MVWHVHTNPRYEKKRKNIKWTREMDEKLMQLVKQYEDAKKNVQWRTVSQTLNKEPWSCYNKYLQLTDPSWTTDEEERLGRLYERARSQRGFQLEDYQRHFPEHKLKMILFKLEEITRWNKFKPRFTIPLATLQKVD